MSDRYATKEEMMDSWFPNSKEHMQNETGFAAAEGREEVEEGSTVAERLFPNSLKDETEERNLEESVEGGPQPSMEIKTMTGEKKVSYNDGYRSIRDYAEMSATADFYLADLENQDLSQLDIAAKDFSYAGMKGANLSNSKMREADFRGADLRGVDLRGTDLRQAIFDENTRFDGNTKFGNTNVEGADLSKVDGLSLEQLKGMKNLHFAKGK